MINIGTAHNIPQIVGVVQLGYINSYIRFFLLVVTLMVRYTRKIVSGQMVTKVMLTF